MLELSQAQIAKMGVSKSSRIIEYLLNDKLIDQLYHDNIEANGEAKAEYIKEKADYFFSKGISRDKDHHQLLSKSLSSKGDYEKQEYVAEALNRTDLSGDEKMYHIYQQEIYRTLEG